MDPRSGRIYKAEGGITLRAMEQSVRRMLEGDDTALVPIPPEMSEDVHSMTQEERLAWAAVHREKLRARAQSRKQTKNQRKARRRARRGR